MISHHIALSCIFTLVFTACSSQPGPDPISVRPETPQSIDAPSKPKVLQLALRAKVGSLDPVSARTVYDSNVQSQIFESLYTYKYLVRPYEIQPLLAKSLPRVSPDGLTYTIDLREDVLFHDDACFPNAKGRIMVAEDLVYSIKRMADPRYSPSGWWVYADRIVGFDDYQKRVSVRGQREAEIDTEFPGIKVLSQFRVQIQLLRPWPQLVHILAMSYSAVVPRECVEKYDGLREHPIGTGPYRLREWIPGERVVLDKNPDYRDERFPSEASPAHEGMLADAGKKIPFIDSIVYSVYEYDSPMWAKFKDKKLHLVQLPSEFHSEVFTKSGEVKKSVFASNKEVYSLPLLDLIYRGFNMSDPVVGIDEKAKFLRQAISLATDTIQVNETFYKGTSTLYDGPVPPGLSSYSPGVTSPYRGTNLNAAKKLMTKAGYPGGKGLPNLHYYTSTGGNIPKQAEFLARSLAGIGITLEVHLESFAELSHRLKTNRAQLFGLAWGADYPDAENFLQLFFGPNASPGSNNFNYQNPEFDALFIQARTMQPSPARTELYKQMRSMLIEDVPSFGHMARTRSYLWHGDLRNVLPNETFGGWLKYLDLNSSGQVLHEN